MRVTQHPPILATVATLCVLGCSDSAGSGGSTDFQTKQDAAIGRAESDSAESADAGRSVPVEPHLEAGRYASRQRLANRMIAAALGDPKPTTTTTWVLHNVVHKNGVTEATTQVCKIAQSPVSGVQTSFPEPLIAAVPATTQRITATQTPDGTMLRWQADVAWLGASATATTDADIANVAPADTDGDGKPGVTVKLSGLIDGELYVVQRTQGGMHGPAGKNGAVDGLFDGHSKQRTLAGNPAALAGMNITFARDPDDSRSTFKWRPVAADTDCTKLIATEATLFGPQ